MPPLYVIVKVIETEEGYEIPLYYTGKTWTVDAYKSRFFDAYKAACGVAKSLPRETNAYVYVATIEETGYTLVHLAKKIKEAT